MLCQSAVGKSRSATILTAYLIYKNKIPPDAALAIIREVRPMVEPNSGFMEQLQLYYDNLDQAVVQLDEVPAYQRYLYRKEVELSTAAGLAPKVEHYAEDKLGGALEQGENVELRCKRCR